MDYLYVTVKNLKFSTTMWKWCRGPWKVHIFENKFLKKIWIEVYKIELIITVDFVKIIERVVIF